MVWIGSTKAQNHYGRSRQYLNSLWGQRKLKRRKVLGKVQFETDNMDQFFGFNPYAEIKEKPTPRQPAPAPAPAAKPKPKKRTTGKRTEPTIKELEEKILNLDLPDNPDNLTTVNQVDIALKKTKIVAQNIKNDFDKCRLIERDKVESLFFEISRLVRDSLESIPPRLSALLVDRTKHEIEQMLIEEIKLTLTNLSLEI